ncbi:hypothetical protein OIDMADRAFT_23565 [Oidiodendron maius Zn]|uniref:Uncharacterized protein n=1 Tax=Oidiodendron maius (strain Zn) TaxID=913774 RepID=A0A0C3I141_OIDMZ|nr:hypothetical protein OIDMADRAFT_23565 [Oidiodendron maius Zn]
MGFRPEVSSTGQSGSFTKEPAVPCVPLPLDDVDWRNSFNAFPFAQRESSAFTAEDYNHIQAIPKFDTFLFQYLSVDDDSLIQQGDIGSFIDENESQFEPCSDSGNSIHLECSAYLSDPVQPIFAICSPPPTPALTYGAPTPPESQSPPRDGVCAIDPSPHMSRQVSHYYRSPSYSDLET